MTQGVHLVLWEQDVHAVNKECSYCLRGVIVHAYGAVKFLLFGVHCVMKEVNDAEVESGD